MSIEGQSTDRVPISASNDYPTEMFSGTETIRTSTTSGSYVQGTATIDLLLDNPIVATNGFYGYVVDPDGIIYPVPVGTRASGNYDFIANLEVTTSGFTVKIEKRSGSTNDDYILHWVYDTQLVDLST